MMRNIREMIAAIMAIAIFSFSCMPVPARTVIGGFGNINPVYNGTYDVGSPALYWEDGYFANLHVGTLVAGGNVTAHASTHASTGADSVNHNTLANLTVGDPHTQYIKADGTRAFSGAQSMGGNALVTMADPTNNQDAATKYYVDSRANVTGTGTVRMIPYWSTVQNLNSTNMYYNAMQNRYGIGTINPELSLHIHNGGAIADGIQLSYTIGTLYTNITNDIFGYLSLMPSGGRVGINDMTPTKALDVNGDVQIQDNLVVGGNTELQDQVLLTGSGLIYQQKTMPIQIARIIAAGKPDRVERGIFQGFSLPVGGADEELFTCQCIPSNWNTGSNMTLYVGGWIDTANTGKKFQLRVAYNSWGAGDVVPATSTNVDVETDTGTASQYQAYKIKFAIPAGSMARGNALGIRLSRIAATSAEITGEFVVEGMVLVYQCDSLGSVTD